MTQLEFDFDDATTGTYSWSTQEYYNKYYWNLTNSNLSIVNIKPSYNMQFSKDNVEVGKIDWNGPEMIFSGKLAPSARVFFDYLAGCFAQRLTQEYNNGFQDGQIKDSL